MITVMPSSISAGRLPARVQSAALPGDRPRTLACPLPSTSPMDLGTRPTSASAQVRRIFVVAASASREAVRANRRKVGESYTKHDAVLIIGISQLFLCGMRTAPATYRNVRYRLLPGDRVTGERLMGLRGACRFTRNEIKEAMELQYSHACGRGIESPTLSPSSSSSSRSEISCTRLRIRSQAQSRLQRL